MTGFDIWNELGNIYFKVGAFDEAIDAYNKAIELDFRIGWLYSNLGFAYAHKGKFAEAIPMYEKSIELLSSDQDKAVSWSRLGEAYRQLQQYEPAAQAYQKAVELAPDDVSFSAGLSGLQEQLDGQELAAAAEAQAQPALEEAEAPEMPVVQDELPAQTDPDDEQALFEAAEDESDDTIAAGVVSRLFAEEALPEAGLEIDETAAPLDEPALEDIEAAQPEAVPAEANDVPVLEETGLDDLPEEPASAAGILEQDEIKITVVNSLLSSGLEFWRKGEHEKASEILQDALEAAGKAENKWLEALSHNALALVKTELGKLEEAIKSYTQAMELAPEKIIPWNNIGQLYSKLDRNDEAMQAFLKAIEHNPEDFVSWDGLGDIYAKLGRLNDAIAAYQLGNVFGKQRRTEDALTAYQLIIEPEIEEEMEFEAPENINWVPELPEMDVPEPEPFLARAEEPEAELSEAAPAAELPAQPEQVEDAPVSEEVSEDGAPEVIAATEEMPAEVADHALPEEDVPLFVAEQAPAVDDSAQPEEAAVAEEAVEEPVAALAETPAEPPAAEAEIAPVEAAVPDDVPSVAENVVAEAQPVDELEASAEPAEAEQAGQPAEETSPAAPEATEEQEPAVAVQVVEVEAQAEESEPDESEMDAQVEEELLEDASSGVELSRLTSAIAAYKKVTEINPENDRAWDSLGNLYRASERYGDAVWAFERAIALRPNKEVYHYHLGLVYAAENHYEEAIGAFQKVIELNPEYTFAHCALAGYFRKLGRDEEAQEHIEKALPKMTSEKEYDRACFAAICGNTDEAIDLLKIALEKKQTSLDWVRRDPDLDFIRDDKRFKSLIARNGSWSERLSDVFSKQLAWSPNK